MNFKEHKIPFRSEQPAHVSANVIAGVAGLDCSPPMGAQFSQRAAARFWAAFP